MKNLEFFVKLFDEIERKILACSFQKLFFLLLGCMIVKVGIWMAPYLYSSLAIAKNPFINTFVDKPNAQFLMYSWLTPFVTWCLNLTNITTFFLFHLCCSIGFLVLFAKKAFETQSLNNAKKAVILFFLFPVAATSFFWVGMDSATLLLMMLSLYFHENVKWSFLFACLLGMQHFELGFVSALALMFPIVVNRFQGENNDLQLKHVIIYLSGIIIGRSLLVMIFKSSGIVLVNNRELHAVINCKRYIKEFLLHFQVILWSILGVGWLLVFRFYQLYAFQKALLLSILVVGIFITSFVGDQTRVACIILFPLIWVFLLNNSEFLEKLTWIEIISGLGLWLIIPWISVWGTPRWSVFPYDVYCILYKLFHYLPWPDNAWVWPFT